MAKQVIGNLKLRIPAGRATAGPPVGSNTRSVGPQHDGFHQSV
jgi:ribosomal protein L11